jgi:hypothetical protein
MEFCQFPWNDPLRNGHRREETVRLHLPFHDQKLHLSGSSGKIVDAEETSTGREGGGRTFHSNPEKKVAGVVPPEGLHVQKKRPPE